MECLRTPDDRFAALPGYGFAPRYVTLDAGGASLRMHYLDEGASPDADADADADMGPGRQGVALCLHGQPTWSYLYRKLIPPLVAGGYRVVAPDLFGFGRSDKPVDEAVYTFDFHRRALLDFVERLDLQDILLVCQDWGGLLGLTLPLEMPSRFARLLVMNTALATGEKPLGEGFLAWRAYHASRPDLDIAALMRRSVPGLGPAEAAAYAAPFPDARHKAGVRRFPLLVPDHAAADGAAVSRAARDWWRDQWQGQSFMAIGMQDPVLGPPVMRSLQRTIRHCPPPLELAAAGHFVQEAGAVVVEAALAGFGRPA